MICLAILGAALVVALAITRPVQTSVQMECETARVVEVEPGRVVVRCER